MEFSSQDLARLSDNSLYQSLGILIQEAAGGQARSTLKPNPAVCWPFVGQPHGGILFTLMDTTMAWAVLTGLEQGRNCTTISLEVQYTQPARSGAFTCRARVVHPARKIVYASAEVLDDQDRLICVGQGAFRVIKADF